MDLFLLKKLALGALPPALVGLVGVVVAAWAGRARAGERVGGARGAGPRGWRFAVLAVLLAACSAGMFCVIEESSWPMLSPKFSLPRAAAALAYSALFALPGALVLSVARGRVARTAGAVVLMLGVCAGVYAGFAGKVAAGASDAHAWRVGVAGACAVGVVFAVGLSVLAARAGISAAIGVGAVLVCVSQLLVLANYAIGLGQHAGVAAAFCCAGAGAVLLVPAWRRGRAGALGGAPVLGAGVGAVAGAIGAVAMAQGVLLGDGETPWTWVYAGCAAIAPWFGVAAHALMQQRERAIGREPGSALRLERGAWLRGGMVIGAASLPLVIALAHAAWVRFGAGTPAY